MIRKGTGPDNVHRKVLKETNREIVHALKTVFNLSLRRGSVPGDWKAAEIHPGTTGLSA